MNGSPPGALGDDKVGASGDGRGLLIGSPPGTRGDDKVGARGDDKVNFSGEKKQKTNI